MSAAKHYDVVVVGASLGALVAASLLARRSWRVLVLGQGARPSSYEFEGHRLMRRPFSFLSASTPSWRRVTAELAQSQTLRRRLSSPEPVCQVASEGCRFDVRSDATLFGREIEREFGEVRRVVGDLYAELSSTRELIDAVFSEDAVWPPGTFWERRETHRLAARLPLTGDEAEPRFLAELPREHPFRRVVSVTASFATSLAEPLPPLSLARAHSAWTRDLLALDGGEAELVELLVERTRAHGGEVRLGDSAVEILTRGGKVTGVLVEGDDVATGTTFVVTDLSVREALALAPGYELPRRAEEKLVPIETVAHRYSLSLVLPDEAVPEPLGRELFVLASPAAAGGRPTVDVHVHRARGAQPGTTLLAAECVLARGGPLLQEAREAIFEQLAAAIPFFEQHTLVCDSPYDGRPLFDATSGAAPTELAPRGRGRGRHVERARLRGQGLTPDPEPMPPLFRCEGGWLSGVGGEAVRGPVEGTFHVGPTVLPGLGQEGLLLAAWGAARIITRTDRRKEKMLREMWSKVELT